MKKILSTFAVAAMLVGGLAGGVTPAEAAAPSKTKNCVKKSEFKKVKRGHSLEKVRRVTGAKGRVSSESEYSDGDAMMTLSFRQCGKSWRSSIISISFGMTETEVYVPDWICYTPTDCEDWGTTETVYSEPYIVTSKSAYWM